MIFLHIGKAKSGTTTIQHGLFLNKRTLVRNNYLYPESGITAQGHHNLYFELTNDARYNPQHGNLKDLQSEIRSFKQENKSGHVILSSETFEALPSVPFSKLYKALSALDEITTILILRRQDEFLKSYWAMQVSRMLTGKKINKWVLDKAESDLGNPNGNKFRLDYHSRIERLRSIIGSDRLIVEGYEKLKRLGLFSSFVKLLGINAELATPTNLHVGKNNYALELIRQSCLKFGLDIDPKFRKALLDSIDLCSKELEWASKPNAKPRLEQATISRTLDIYKNCNEKLYKVYPHLKGNLDPPHIDTIEEVDSQYQISNNDLISLLNKIYIISQS